MKLLSASKYSYTIDKNRVISYTEHFRVYGLYNYDTEEMILPYNDYIKVVYLYKCDIFLNIAILHNENLLPTYIRRDYRKCGFYFVDKLYNLIKFIPFDGYNFL